MNNDLSSVVQWIRSFANCVIQECGLRGEGVDEEKLVFRMSFLTRTKRDRFNQRNGCRYSSATQPIRFIEDKKHLVLCTSDHKAQLQVGLGLVLAVRPCGGPFYEHMHTCTLFEPITSRVRASDLGGEQDKCLAGIAKETNEHTLHDLGTCQRKPSDDNKVARAKEHARTVQISFTKL
jgi:hypothetical protein